MSLFATRRFAPPATRAGAATLLLLTGCAPGGRGASHAAAATSGAGAAAPASNACVRALQRESDELWQGRLEVLPEIAADTFVVHYQGRAIRFAAADAGKVVMEWRTAFPDIRKTIVSAIAHGDTVATRAVVTGTHQRDFLGIKATGRPIRFTQMNFTRCEGGKFVESWEVFDMEELKQQMAAKP